MASAEGRGRSMAEAFREGLRAAGAGPRVSYTAKSPAARYKHLMSTRAGRDALEQAGLPAVRQTRRRWIAGRQKPGRANAAVINAVYEALSYRPIPDALKAGKMRITGRVGTGSDIRERGRQGNAPLLIDLSNGYWGNIDRAWDDDSVGDVELENMISDDLIIPDIGGSDNWYFPGSDYKVEFDY
jgi:hypothetical protein